MPFGAFVSFRSDKALARVNYRDMGTEELGSVYESLLELQPAVDAALWTFGFIGDANSEKTRGSERKLTGSYYTPSTLVNQLIKSALEPVLVQAIADRPEDPRAAILNLKVLDPACGSGHFLLAAARRMAAEIARIEAGSDISDEIARQHAPPRGRSALYLRRRPESTRGRAVQNGTLDRNSGGPVGR